MHSNFQLILFSSLPDLEVKTLIHENFQTIPSIVNVTLD